jgi:hypothetical protein
MEYYSAIKKNEIVGFFCRKMDGTGDHYVKWNKPDLEREISRFLL